MARRRGWWLFAAVGLVLGACSGDDSSPTGAGGSSAAGGTGGAGGSSDPGGAAGSHSGGTAGTGGEAGASGSTGSGGTGGNPDAGSGGAGGKGDAGNDGAPPTSEGGEAGPCLPAGTMTVVNEASDGYLFDGGPLNPVLTLCRGNKYTFEINAPGHPIYIRTSIGTSFTDGVTGNHISSGNLVFDVPLTAPPMLFYQCDIHDAMTGVIQIVD